MIPSKRIKYHLIIAILVGIYFKSYAQVNEEVYKHKMQLMDSLSYYKMQYFDTLYHIVISQSFLGNEFKSIHEGWISKQSAQEISLLTIYGKVEEIEKKNIIKKQVYQINQSLVDTFINRAKNIFDRPRGDFAGKDELILWLYKKGQYDYSKQIYPTEKGRLDDRHIRNGFGAIYYDAMLSAFSNERNYKEAILFGTHLSQDIFKEFDYYSEAGTLNIQLKNNPEDFKSFCLPDSAKWLIIKQKLNREQQIIYLADKLRLLNCIQPGQPAGIDYNMYQYSVPFSDAGKLEISYWEHNAKYEVVNPYVELIKMKLTLRETELLLPYLTTDYFIASYNYHRDFFPERNLHHLSWVVESIIYNVTNKVFFDRLKFDLLTPEQKKLEIEKIKTWCEENVRLSPESRTIKVLKTADNWADFYGALQTAKENKYDSILIVLAQRFKDFDGKGWPSHQGIIAQTMFEQGGDKYTGVVKKWSDETTDNWVKLWTSLFLLKYDRQDYSSAMAQLTSVLKQCDGITYYPHAIDVLLNLNDPATVKLAAGIMEKQQFQFMMYWPGFINIIKKLILHKSDDTFNILTAKLAAYSPEEMARQHHDNDRLISQNDGYVLVAEGLKKDKPVYLNQLTKNAERLKYIISLNKWFKTQYELLKAGKPNDLNLEIIPAGYPTMSIDTYDR